MKTVSRAKVWIIINLVISTLFFVGTVSILVSGEPVDGGFGLDFYWVYVWLYFAALIVSITSLISVSSTSNKGLKANAIILLITSIISLWGLFGVFGIIAATIMLKTENSINDETVNTVEADLKKLTELLNSGVITQEEYNQKRSELLARI